MKPIVDRNFEWATNGAIDRDRRILSSIYIDPPAEEVANFRLGKRWQEVQANEGRYKEYYLDDAEFVVVGFRTAGAARFRLSARHVQRESRLACCARSLSAHIRMMSLINLRDA